MRIFVYEHLCGKVGGLGTPTLSTLDALAAEGWAMLSAVLEDFARVPGVEPCTLLVEHGPSREPLHGTRGIPGALRVSPKKAAAAFRELAANARYTLVIAPESDGILLSLCRAVEEAGGRLLGPTPAAVQLAGDKLALGQHLADRGIPTPPCRLFSAGTGAAGLPFPAVWKPRHGAGSQATFLIRDPEGLDACPRRAAQEGYRGEAIVQPFAPGIPVSVAFLVGPEQQIALPPAAQDLSDDGRFHYRGGSLPLGPELADRCTRLARRAVGTVEGLRGYVGMDLVLGPAAGGAGDQVIEINPRLTTSYVGLRALARFNLAEAMLRVVQGQEIPEPAWHAGGVRFRADGTITTFSAEAARCGPATPACPRTMPP